MDSDYKAACAPFFSEERIALEEKYLRDKGMSDAEILYYKQIWAIQHFYDEYLKRGGTKEMARSRMHADAKHLWLVFKMLPDFDQPKPDLGY